MGKYVQPGKFHGSRYENFMNSPQMPRILTLIDTEKKCRSVNICVIIRAIRG